MVRRRIPFHHCQVAFFGLVPMCLQPVLCRLTFAAAIPIAQSGCGSSTGWTARRLEERPWGREVGDVGFTNAIGDLMVSSVFRPGPVYRMEPTVEILEGEWELVTDGRC